MTTSNLFETIEATYTYPAYKQIALALAEKSETSGEQTKEHIDATLINAQRLKGIDKTIDLNADLKTALQNLKNHYTWYVISESWCGDSAQSLPIIAKMAEETSHIDLQIVFRDEHPDLMDAFLSHGTRSIPKLICLNPSTFEVVGTWGPKPKSIEDKSAEFKRLYPEADHDEFVKNLHLWYARDKAQSIQAEFIELLTYWDSF